LAIVLAQRTVLVWDVDDSEPPRVLCADRSDPGVSNVAFSPDGEKILLVLYEGIAEVWPLRQQAASMVLKGHRAEILDTAFSPDGRRVVTASEDGTVKVWDLVQGKESVHLEGHEGPVRSASFSPNGACIVTASDDGTARVWRVTWDGLLDYLQASTVARLVPQQRHALLGEPASDNGKP
jgi:WD40 repeat protein